MNKQNIIDGMNMDSLREQLKSNYDQESKARKEWNEIVEADLSRFKERRVDILNQMRAIASIKALKELG